jgi:predicted short-subunit dehydrogenase-like oxidoreductase (DUF2520 family)
VVRSRRVASKLNTVYSVDAEVVSIRKLKKLASGVIFITTEDPGIATVAKSIASIVGTHQTVFHTSGSLSSEVLAPLADSGANIGSFHPLTSVSDPILGATQFKSTYFCVEGDDHAVRIGKRIVKALGGKSFTIETESKPLYHAAAVTAAGHVTTLFDTAVEIMELAGIEREKGSKILDPLIESAVENLNRQTPEKALTGTFARLDIEAFERHLSVLRKTASADILRVYLDLGARSLDIVERRDGPSEMIGAFRKAVFMARQKLR